MRGALKRRKIPHFIRLGKKLSENPVIPDKRRDIGKRCDALSGAPYGLVSNICGAELLQLSTQF